MSCTTASAQGSIGTRHHDKIHNQQKRYVGTQQIWSVLFNVHSSPGIKAESAERETQLGLEPGGLTEVEGNHRECYTHTHTHTRTRTHSHACTRVGKERETEKRERREGEGERERWREEGREGRRKGGREGDRQTQTQTQKDTHRGRWTHIDRKTESGGVMVGRE